MIFTIISYKVNHFNSPLVAEYEEPEKFFESPSRKGAAWDAFYVFDGLELAIEYGIENANPLNYEISKNLFWATPESFDDVVKLVLKKLREEFKEVEILFSLNKLRSTLHEFGSGYVFSEPPLLFFKTGTFRPMHAPNLYLRSGGYYVFNEEVETYFNISVDPTLPQTIRQQCREYNSFNVYRKANQMIGEVYEYENFVKYIKRISPTDYPIDMLNILSEAFSLKENNDNTSRWQMIEDVEKYFSKVKIYNVSSDPDIDFDFKKDKEGKLYLQYDYNAMDTVNGRMFPKNLNGYQALQNIPKHKRHLVKCSPGNVLYEVDFVSCEFSLLLQFITFIDLDSPDVITKTSKTSDLHLEICDHLGVNRDREFGKKINYSYIFGRNVESLADMILEEPKRTKRPQTKEELIHLLKTFHFFGQIQLATKKIKEMYFDEKKMVLTTIFGRKFKVEKMHALLQNFISASAADYFYEMVLIMISKNNCNVKLQNFDSVLVESKPDSIDFSIDFSFLESGVVDSESRQYILDYKISSGTNWGMCSDGSGCDI